MKKIRLKNIIAIFAILFLFSGCGGRSSSSVEQRPSLNEDNIINSASEEVALEPTQFSEGIVTEDIVVEVEDKDNTVVAQSVIPESTQFVNSNGDEVDTPPVVSIALKESVEEEVDDGKKIVKSVVQTNLQILNDDGDKLIPSEPINVKVKAPEGTKAGDKVKVYIPDDATVSTKMTLSQEKLVIVTVGADGYVNVIIIPQIFKDETVVVILIERVDEIPITGGTGGN